MNRTLILTLAALAGFSAGAAADTITTIRGKTYVDCKIAQVHPDGISFTHRKGAAKILFTDLPSSMREKYGYDPKKAAAYSKKITEQRKEREKRVQEHLARQQEAIEAAQFATAMRYAEIEAQQQQQAYQQQVWMPAQGFYTSAVGFPNMSPIYGPVVNGAPYRPRGWDGVGIAPVVPGTSGIYIPQSGGYSWYPPISPSLGYARPGYTVGGSFNVGGGVRIGVGVGAVPAVGPMFAPPPPALPAGIRGSISIGR
ncbi:MAG: hypothetical protein JNN17_17630 [Verrucomicrobiaceae bacterium]|nr:hypothetical protein [Verrucomicrobiaceae bacterium]